MDYYLVGRDCYQEVQNLMREQRKSKFFDEEYIRIGRMLLEEGKWVYNERTGKRCLTIRAEMAKYDMTDTDSFPLLTTKKMDIRPIAAELIGFIKGYDSAAQFREEGCKIWDANANHNEQWLNNPNRKGEDDLGRIYGVQARNRNSFFKMPSNYKPKPEKQTIPRKFPEFKNSDIDIENSLNDSTVVGKRILSNSCGEFVVIRHYREDGQSFLDLKFINTGYVVKKSQYTAALRGEVKDPYHPNVCGIAAMGVVKDNALKELLSPTWRDMINRCYGDKRLNSAWYKDRDVWVSDRWLLFENFVEDFKKMDRWEMKLEYPDMYTLDKDFYCSNYYSLHTCIWSSKREQNINTRQAKQFIAISPDGDRYEECGISNFCDKHDLNRRSVEMALASGNKIKGWTFVPLESNAGDNVRIRIDDQLAQIIAKLKHTPDDRRILVDHWNPSELHMMALPPCHVAYYFTALDGYLHMTMVQRSCDYPLGVPYNIASYALLLHIVANMVGLKVGELSHVMHNIHIYEDQLELFKEQMERKPKASPRIEVPTYESLEDFTEKAHRESFLIRDYNPDEAIRFPFSV